MIRRRDFLKASAALVGASAAWRTGYEDQPQTMIPDGANAVEKPVPGVILREHIDREFAEVTLSGIGVTRRGR